MKKQRKVTWLIYFINFFWAIAFALPLYIQSSYIESIVGIKYVGLVLSISTAATLLAMIVLPNFLKKFHNFRVTIFISLFIFVDTFLIYTVPGIWSIFFYIIFIAWMTLLVICFDIFLERVANFSEIGRIRTVKLLFINVAFLISPLISGNLLGWYESYRLVFFIAGFAFLIVPILMLLRKKDLDDRTVEYRKRTFKSLKRVFKTHPNITRSVFIEFGLRFFYATMVLYVPIYLHEQMGFDWPTIGIILTIMLIPFIIIQIPAGWLSDKYIGEKEMIIGGIFFMIISSVFVAQYDLNSVLWWSVILFMTRVGAALLESMNEVFFFKHIKSNDMDLIDIFRDIRPVGWLSASLVSFIIMIVFPGDIRHVIWTMILVLLIILYPAFRLVDTK